MFIFLVCTLGVLKILGVESLAREMKSGKNIMVSVVKFVVQDEFVQNADLRECV